jgi:hypothetical protein
MLIDERKQVLIKAVPSAGSAQQEECRQVSERLRVPMCVEAAATMGIA